MPDLRFFNANEVPDQIFEPLPDGIYVARIIESEEKETKAGTGSYIQLKLEVVEGEYTGRTVFDRLNLRNPNEKAVEIARQTLASICRAVGNMAPRDTQELHDIPMAVKIISLETGDGDAGFGGGEGGPPASAAPRAPAAAPHMCEPCELPSRRESLEGTASLRASRCEGGT